MASELTEIGAKLHLLIKQNNKNIETRNKAINLLNNATGTVDDDPNHQRLQTSLLHLVNTLGGDSGKIKQHFKDMAEVDLIEKIGKKSQELIRARNNWRV